MKNKKIITLIATLGLITCLHTKVDAVKFYDTLGTRYEGAVERLAELEIINGISENTFNANRSITRAEFAKLIVEATLTQEEIWALSIDNEQLNFTDISRDAWYYKYVLIATNYGYINGYEDNTFKPNKEVTYEEAAKMLMKALGHGYLVETDPRGWSAEYMDKLYSLNIADGTVSFEKGENATRGNIAILLWNTLTNNVWEKIWLNDVTGFTYVDSGKTLFDKKVSGYVFRKNLEIKGFREVNGKLCVQTSNVAYNQLFDQNITVNFSMIGGKTDVLYKIVRYAQNEIKYEIVGLSPDIGSQLYEGAIDELKEDGMPLRVTTEKFSKDANYGYYVKAENEEDSRLLTVNTKNKRFFVDKIEIKTEKVTIKEDEDFVIEDENDVDYLYVGNYDAVTKTITINEDYEIKDGAVLFENNKRVDWSTVKAGDVITEIEKDKYYFVSREVIDVTVKDYDKTINEIKFATSEGDFIAFKNTECVEYYSKENKVVSLFNLGTSKLDALIDTRVKLHLDFAGNIARLEVLEDYTAETETADSLQKLGVGYYYTLDYGSTETNNMITLVYDGKKKAYKTALKSTSAEFGDLVVYKLDNSNAIEEIKVITSGVALNEKFKMNSVTYDKLNESIQEGNTLDNVSVYHSKYYYDFGEYDKVIDFEVEKTTMDIIDELNQDKVDYYAITDSEGRINIILVMDYSEQKDMFYGKINNIYLTDDNVIKAEIEVLGYKNVTYTISGLVNCEEGDVVSFERLDKDSIKILEKFTVKSLGYYKDIIVNDVNWNNEVTSENGEVNLEEGKIIVGTEEYKFSEFDILLLNVSKNGNGSWYIDDGEYYTGKNLKLKDNDRIAINEIEDTIIIYRGYKE